MGLSRKLICKLKMFEYEIFVTENLVVSLNQSYGWAVREHEKSTSLWVP